VLWYGWLFNTPSLPSSLFSSLFLLLLCRYKQNLVDYPQLGWSFLGMQKSGLYRNWPLIYQCRTEHVCSGCSDPRFRSWYV
jgi:hypothetical protein